MSENPFNDLAEALAELKRVNVLKSPTFGISTYAMDLQMLAAGHYQTCVELLKAADLYEEHFGDVMAPVRTALSHAGDRSLSNLESVHLKLIRMVGKETSISRLLPSALTADELLALRETFVKIHEIVDSHESIPENLKSHLVYLCKRGIDLIDGEDVDLVALRSVCFETSGVGFAASVAFPQDAQGAWFDRLRGLWVWGSKVAAAGAIEYGVHKALEAAGGSL